MKRIFTFCLCVVIAGQVLTAPTDSNSDEEGDSVEQELIRNHHSTTADRLKSKNKQQSTDSDETSAVESIENIEETDDEDDTPITEEDIYDITVGDVIRDVLLTLRDHPEIVRELIASEKAKLSQQIDAFNSIVDGDSAGDSLAGYMQPAEQLKTVPKSVEKKTGRSGMAVVPGQSQKEDKRTDEVINDEYTRDLDTDDSEEYKDFMQQIQEGGKDDPMFNYEKENEDIHSEESSHSVSEQSDTSETEPAKKSDNIVHKPYRFPLLNARKLFKGYGQTSNKSSDNVQSSETTSDRNEMTSESRDTQELHKNDKVNTLITKMD